MFIGGTGETVNSTHILELALMKLSERVKWVPKRVFMLDEEILSAILKQTFWPPG